MVQRARRGFILNQSIPTVPGAGKWGCEVSGPASTYVQSTATDPDGKIAIAARGFNEIVIGGKVAFPRLHGGRGWISIA
jgi:hypothetical protein